jgi:hypothetical protein
MYDDIDKKVDEFLRPIGQKYQKYFDEWEREREFLEYNDDSSRYQLEQINKDIKLLNIDKSDYKKWLLNPEVEKNINTGDEIHKDYVDCNNLEDVNNNIDDFNFEIINYNHELDTMDVITDYELDDDEDETENSKNKSLSKKKTNESSCSVSTSSSSSSTSSLFSEIRSKPMEHWLFK